MIEIFKKKYPFKCKSNMFITYRNIYRCLFCLLKVYGKKPEFCLKTIQQKRPLMQLQSKWRNIFRWFAQNRIVFICNVIIYKITNHLIKQLIQLMLAGPLC